MKNSALLIIVCIVIIFVLMTASSYALGTVIFRDDFDFFDTTKWNCQDRDWPIGQTWFKGYPVVANGRATFEHHTYNQFDAAHESCLSQEIFTNTEFSRNSYLEIETRVRVRAPIGNGLIASFFLYMDQPYNPPQPDLANDEIDFEFLTNQINRPYPDGGHRVFVATWNDFGITGSDYYDSIHHWASNPFVPNLNLTEFNVFKIRWLDNCVEWLWDPTPQGPNNDDILIYKTFNALPDESMSVRFNFWAADAAWPLPWDENLRPVDTPFDDVVCYYDVDYVEVRVMPEPATIMLLGLGGIALLRIRQNK